jgi:hypothetical protein
MAAMTFFVSFPIRHFISAERKCKGSSASRCPGSPLPRGNAKALELDSLVLLGLQK